MKTIFHAATCRDFTIKTMCLSFDHGTRCYVEKIEVMTQSTYKICLNNAPTAEKPG